jgi:hypothetical protein
MCRLLYTLINLANATNELLLSESPLRLQETTMKITDEN